MVIQGRILRSRSHGLYFPFHSVSIRLSGVRGEIVLCFFFLMVFGSMCNRFSLSRHRGFASRGIENPVPQTRGPDPLGTCEGGM
ncbi:hypothetical protein BDV26DRAFT_269662 [Aspergillus bertholletiae]|uniref:Uncharacterized protein n=1 Tax=Aspergillus bertholletiae TaxID=1226010 RepID=A0A5N7AXQ9_9EURO|nr:hypothetical protein BDV26DRAFT_269662 [Aspergillus bertholletiae]